MNCNFEFNGVKAPTIEGLLHSIIANDTDSYLSPATLALESKDEGMSLEYTLPFEFFQSELNYHNAEGVRVASIVLRIWTKDRTTKKYIFNPISSHGEAVTKLLNNGQNDDNYASSGNFGYSHSQLEHIDQYCTFCKDLGILIHKCLEIAINTDKATEGPYISTLDYLDSIKEVWNFINRYKNVALEWTEATARLMPTKDFILKANEQAVIEKIQEITATMLDAIKSRGDGEMTIMAEVPIKYQHPTDPTRKPYSGIIDVLAYDTKGNVWIFDFKTSSHINFGPKALNAYAFLISAYKEMLTDLGIPAENIHMELLPLEYKVNLAGEITINYTDPSATRQTAKNLKLPLSIWELSHLKKNLRRFFPVTRTALTVDEAHTRDTKLDSQINTLITPLLKKKASLALLRKFLESAIKNGRATMIWSEDGSYGRAGVIISKWVQEGDVYVGYTETGDEKIRGTLDEIAQKEVDALNRELQLKTEVISEALSMGDYDSIRDLFFKDEDKAQKMLFALEPYLSPDWEEIHIPELRERNIITMYNEVTKEVSFIVVSELSSLIESRILLDDESKDLIPPDANIIYQIVKDKKEFKKYKAFNELPGLKVEEHLTLEALLTINLFKDLLPQSADGKITLGRIQVVSGTAGTSTSGLHLEKYVQTLKLLEYISINSPESMKEGTAELFKDSYSSFSSTFTLADPLLLLCNLVMNRIGAYKLNCPDIGLDMFSSDAVEMDLIHIELAMEEIKLFYKESEYNRNMDDPIGRIYYGLLLLTASLKRGNVNDLIHKLTKHGLTGAELFGAGLDLLRYGESRAFSYNGLLVAGMALGLDNSVSYASSDSSIRFLQRLISSASLQINVETILIADEINAATKKYLDACKVSGFSRWITGNTASVYEVLYEHTPDGKMSGLMILKNPYGSNDLTDYQREYLEVVLWSFNRLRIVGLDSKVKKMTYAELKEDSENYTKYKEIVNLNDKYRYVPLVRHDGTLNLITTFKILVNPDESLEETNTKTRNVLGRLVERWNQHIQPLLLTPEQRKYESKDFDPKNGEFSYHSPYNLLGQHRVETLQNNDIRDWEINLNFLTIEHAAALFKEIYYNLVLKMASNILAEIEIAETMTGQDLTKTKEALVDRITVSMFHRDLIDDEHKTMATVIGALKLLTSYSKIAVRPGLFIKEMILGLIKNAATIWAKNLVNDVPITFNHIMKAATIVYTNGLFTENAGKFEGETFGDFRLVNTLNNYYRINDRDLNIVGDSLSYDHHGILNTGSRFLYLNTTSPDWFHRMTLLVAKMIADGSWEAHRIEDGKLIYDAGKDERYKEFVLYLRAHDGDLTGEPTHESYVMAKALYLLKILQLKQDGYSYLKGGENGEFSDNIPLAYSTLEIDSYKELIGMIFGYYSHEERTNTLKGLSWLLHTLFMTFVPGEVRKYLASGKHESSAGKVVHMIDPVTHEKLYYVTNEEGLDVIEKESNINPAERTKPVVLFTFVPLEGLLVSTVKTLNEIFTGKWDAEANRDRHNRAKLFLFNFLLGLILKGLWGLLIALGAGSIKDAAKELKIIAEGLKLAPKIGQELDFFDSTGSVLSNLGLAGLDIIPEATSSVLKLPGALGKVLKEGALL